MFNHLRKYATLFLGAPDRIIQRFPEITVLCYHHTANTSWLFNTPPEIFKKQILALKKTHVFITGNQFELYMQGKTIFDKPAILLTFDDGYTSILDVADFLKEENIKPILFFESKPQHILRDEVENNFPLLTKQEVIKLIKDGWTLGSHGATHYNLLNADDAILHEEINESKKTLEQEFGQPVNYFAYARGLSNKKIQEAAKNAGYIYSFIVREAVLSKKSNHMSIPRIGVMQTHGLAEFISMQTKTVLTTKNLVRTLFHT